MKGKIRKVLIIHLLILSVLGFGISGCQRSTPQAAGTPSLTNSYEISAADSGKTFTYNITTRFTVILDPNLYPKDELEIRPEGIVGSISNVPAVQPPLYAVRFETIRAGECILKDRDFQVKIQVVE